MVAVVFDPSQSDLASFVYAALAVGLVLGLLNAIIESAQQAQQPAQQAQQPPTTAGSRKGLSALFIGADNRVSTSKVQLLLWTLAVVWGLLVLVFRLSINDAAQFDEAFDIQAEYLILVGFPATAGLVSKVLTKSRVDTGAMDKPPAPEPKLGDIVTNDEGAADLGDWQYFLFNLVALATFFRLFLPSPEKGLPTLPDTLVALTGASAAIYVAKKGTESQQRPSIRWVRPSRVVLEPTFELQVAGSDFVAANDSPPTTFPRGANDNWWIALGGVELIVEKWNTTMIRAKLPDDAADFATLRNRSDAELVVYDTRGRASDPKEVPLTEP